MEQDQALMAQTGLHPLQRSWANVADEQEYVRRISALVHAGQPDDALAALLSDLALLDTPLARLCHGLSAEEVAINGWDEVSAAIEQFEGDPITAVHLMMSNPTDLVFEAKADLYEPILEIAFYTDANLAFSMLTRDALLTAALNPAPEWYGQSEDIEIYAELAGFAELNTMLLRHKTQFFLRNDGEGGVVETAPLGYVEYILASLFRSVCFHQLVKAELDRTGLPGNIPVLVGVDNMRSAIDSVYYPEVSRVTVTRELASLAVAIKPREDENLLPIESMGSSLRRKIVFEAEPAEPEPETRPGFFQRLFARR